jgi:cell division protein FtsW (lipid II flippase)
LVHPGLQILQVLPEHRDHLVRQMPMRFAWTTWSAFRGGLSLARPINMAMVTGLVPVVGVPLPLVSYGGTSMLTMMVGLGFVLNAHVNRTARMRHHELGPLW